MLKLSLTLLALPLAAWLLACLIHGGTQKEV